MNKFYHRLTLTAIACFLSFAASWLYAQGLGEDRFGVSAQVGINLPQINKYRDIYFANPIAGAGGMVNYRLRSRMYFYGGLFANGLGYTREAIDSNETFLQRSTEWYLDIPLAILYYPGTGAKSWGIFGGLTPSVLLHKGVSRNESTAPYNLAPDPSSPGRFDMMLHAGAMLHISPRWYVSARYNLSLTSLQNVAYNTGRFSSLGIGLGFRITAPEKQNVVKDKQEQVIQPFDKERLVLLVRLKTEHKKIQTLEAAGYHREAADLREEVAEENKETVRAFYGSFTYCPVYFFYDTSSRAIAEARYESQLFNAEGEYTDTAVGNNFDVLIAEFSSPHSEAFGASSGFGLVVYDARFNQMKEPFPYYTQNLFGLIDRDEVVARFERKFINFQSGH